MCMRRWQPESFVPIALVRSSPPAGQHWKISQNPDALPAAHPTVSKHCRQSSVENKNKKALRGDANNTARWLVVRRSQKFSPRRRPPFRGPKLISCRWSLPLPTNPVWWGSMQAISSYRSNRPTHTHKYTHPQTDRADYNTLHRS